MTDAYGIGHLLIYERVKDDILDLGDGTYCPQKYCKGAGIDTCC